MSKKSKALEDIAAERQRQIGMWSEGHDAEHEDGELASAAMCYACPPGIDIRGTVDRMGRPRPPVEWPWAESWWKPNREDRRRELVKAGALIVAEIERLDRSSGGDL